VHEDIESGAAKAGLWPWRVGLLSAEKAPGHRMSDDPDSLSLWSHMSAQPATGAPVERRRDAERTRAEILQVAQREFARHGYAGARVDEIAALMRTTKRMIYYYFGGKEKLYIAVLEEAYA
jgi:hypothetical protein